MTESRTRVDALLVAGGLVALAVNALVVRAVLSDRPSAYMDEATFILTGRFLIERGAVYADALDWTYGSYLWSLVAASVDMAGGLALVRLVVALLGTIMVLATALATARLAPAGPDRWIAALLAGAIVASLPTAIGIGRFATYDALAGAAFMSGVALLIPGPGRQRWFVLLAGTMLLFVAFLAKYVVAIFFPAICLYFLISPLLPPARVRLLAHRLSWFVLPLSAACAAYFWLFQEDLLALLAFSSTYSDLASPFPLREYVYQRQDLWALAALATVGAFRAAPFGRRVALGGIGIVVGFQALTRADVDFWKHSIYPIFFLAPLAGLALAPAVRFILEWHPTGPRRRRLGRTVAVLMAAGLFAPALVLATYPQRVTAELPILAPVLAVLAAVIGSTRRAAMDTHATLALTMLVVLGMLLAPVVELLLEQRAKQASRPLRVWPGRGLAGLGRSAALTATVLVVGALLAAGLTTSLDQSSRILAFYPDVSHSLEAIETHTADARTVLVDDSALRYYLYPRIPTDRVTDPFAVSYRGQHGIDGYRLAIADRYYDVIVLDGGIGPLGRRIRQELGGEVAQYYQRVHAQEAPNRALVEIYRPRESASLSEAPAEGSLVYDFDDGLQEWGGHPDVGELQPGLNVAISQEPSWNGNASLQFTPADDVSMLGVKRTGQVSRVRAQIYIVPDERVAAEIRIAMMAFDEHWQWHDDLFENVLPVGRWAEITWNLPEPGVYHQVGFKFQPGTVRTAYLAQVEVTP